MMKFIFKNNFEKILNIGIAAAFGASFLSIPLFSLVGRFSFITWVLTGLMAILIILNLLFFKPIRVTTVSLSLVMFCVFAMLSTAGSGFKTFLSTPLLNTLLILLLYTYFISQNSKQKKICLSSLFLSLIIFLLIFCISIIPDLKAGNITRLGGKFGDENDIAVILSLGAAFSLFYFLKYKKWYIKTINGLLMLIFSASSFTTGSKIAIVLLLLVSFAIIFLHFGRKKWYISIIIVAIVILTLVGLLQLSIFKLFKDRILDMLYSLVGKQYGVNPDSSTIGRTEMFINGLSLFLRRPLFGYGFNGYHVFSTHHSGWSHNHFSETLCNYGLIGTFFYHVPFVLSLKNKKDKNEFCYIGTIFFIVSMLSIALFKEKMFAFSAGLFFSNAKSTTLIEYNILKKNKSVSKKTNQNSKIVLVEIIPSLNPVGGAETMFVNLCEEIIRNHKECVELNVVILYSYKSNALYNRLFELGVNVHFLDKHRGIDLSCASRLANTLDKINPSIIHSHLGTTITLMLALKFKKTYPIVHTFHHMVGTGFKKELFNRFLIKKNYIYPVAVSELSSKSIMKKTKLDCDYIDNGINIKKFNPSISVEDRQIDFLCVASFRPVKNQKYLVEVFKEVVKTKKDLTLVFLGDGPLKQSCIDEAGDLLNKNITFAGAVDNVGEYMSKSRILVLPSTSEGNPMVINEAIASGMYVIANNVGGIPNLIQNDITGNLIQPGDFNNFKDTMLNKISDFSFLEARRTANIKIIKNYSIETSTNKYVKLFDKLLSF